VNWGRLYSILKGIAGLSGLMAFIGFTYTYYNDVQARQSAQARSWQAVEIFALVLESGESGLSLEELVTGVQRSMIEGRAFTSINPDVATEKQVLGGIIELASKNSIIMGTDNNYRVPLQFATMLGNEAEAARVRNLQNDVLALVNNNPAKFSSDELRDHLRRQGASELDIHRAVIPLLLSGPWGPPMLVASNTGASEANLPRYEQKLELLR
jgi:hypothetical protein